VTAGRVAEDLGLGRSDVEKALLVLEADGWVLRGRFSPDSARQSDEESLEWCERGLLARIQRLTLDGLRRQIEPVAPEQFVRFLVGHQHLDPETRLRGRAGLLAVIEQLQGFDIPAADWEGRVLPARLADYDPRWLDAVTFSGEVLWARVRPRRSSAGRPMKSLTRSMPISLMRRDDLAWLLPPRHAQPDPTSPYTVSEGERPLGGNALAVFEAVRQRGALFTSQLEKLLQILPGHLDDALGELAAAGLVTSDGFSALRRLIGGGAANGSAGRRGSIRRRTPGSRSRAAKTTDSGRWSLVRGMLDDEVDARTRVENWCRLLLRRYGIVFRDLLARERAAPAWFELRRWFQRLEARGEIRGGRFVAKVAGEQYALPESIGPLRKAGPSETNGLVVLTAADPLNLFGRMTPGVKVAVTPGNRVVIESGRLIAYASAGEVQLVTSRAEPELRPRVSQALAAFGS
jgi:ATP-dependent Lhr-like helicase